MFTVVLIVLVIVVVNDDPDDTNQNNTVAAPTSSAEATLSAQDAITPAEKEETETQVAQVKPGALIDYSSTTFADTADTKRVLFFHAANCIVCRQIEANMESSSIPDGVSLLVVRMEDNQDLVNSYNVNQQSTFIQVDNQGNKLKSWNWLHKPSAGPGDLTGEVI